MSAAYLRALDVRRKIPFSRVFKEVLHNQGASHDRLVESQLLILKRIVRHAAATVPAYRGVISESKIVAARTVIDLLDGIPLLSKSQLIADSRAYKSTDCPGPIFFGSTSGSTGNSLMFSFDAEHAAWSEACKWRGRNWWGARRGDSALVLWGRPIVDRRSHRLAQKAKSWLRHESHFDTFESLNEEFLEKVARDAVSSRPTYVYGYGSSLAALARHMKRQGIYLDPSSAPLFVQYTADHMGEYEKTLASEVFSAPVISDYGASEIPGIAEQCRAGNLHVSVDSCAVEVVDHHGNRQDIGVPGELIVTALHNQAMPLLRYRIGDIGRMIPERCSCGNSMPLMELIAGKSTDLITTSYADNVSAHYLDYLNIKIMKSGDNSIAQFQLVQNNRDSFELKIVPTGLGDVESSSKGFANELISRLGPVAINILMVNEIPTERSGKRRYFVNRTEVE